MVDIAIIENIFEWKLNAAFVMSFVHWSIDRFVSEQQFFFNTEFLEGHIYYSWQNLVQNLSPARYLENQGCHKKIKGKASFLGYLLTTRSDPTMYFTEWWAMWKHSFIKYRICCYCTANSLIINNKLNFRKTLSVIRPEFGRNSSEKVILKIKLTWLE